MTVNSQDDVFAGAFGVYRSTDNGQSWMQVYTGIQSFWALISTSNDYLFGGTFASGVFRSTDNGDNWTQLGLHVTIHDLAIDRVGGILAAGDYGMVYRSTDYGETWSSSQVDSTPPYSTITTITVDTTGRVFVGTTSNSGVFRSTDEGATWTQTGLTTGIVASLAIDGSGYVLAALFGMVLRSTDGGTTWAEVGTGLPDTDVGALCIDSQGNLYGATAGAGVFRLDGSSDTWNQIGVPATYVYSFSTNASTYMLAGTRRGLFRSTDNGSSWSQIVSPLLVEDLAAITTNSSGYIFVGTSFDLIEGYGKILRSTNSGITWTELGTWPNAPVKALATTAADHVFAGFFGGGIFRSTDAGDIWAEADSGITNHAVLTLALDSAGTIFAGTCGGGVFRSTDDGFNWSYSGLANKCIQCLGVSPAAGILAGTQSEGIYRSTDNGETWIPKNSGLLDLDVWSLAASTGGSIFAGTRDGGIFRSTDNGDNWVELNYGLTTLGVPALSFNSEGYVLAGTFGSGVFRSTERTTYASEEKNLTPYNFALEQNYPNPFNSTTTIGFGLTEPSYVTLTVFSLLGEKLQTVLAREMQAGTYSIHWDATGMSSGVYFYRLQTGKQVRMRKLIILK